MNTRHQPTNFNEQQQLIPRWVAMGTAASLLFSGCSTVSKAIDGARDEVMAAAVGMGAGEKYNYSEWSACAQPESVLGDVVAQHVAMQCAEEGSINAKVAVVDLTENDAIFPEFLDEFTSIMDSVTDGYITIKPEIVEVLDGIHERVDVTTHKPDTEAQCIDTDNESTELLPSQIILRALPQLQEVPYVLVLSDYPSCDGMSGGIAYGGNGMEVFSTNIRTAESTAIAAAHEMGHVLGLREHVSTLIPLDAKPGFYVFTSDDLVFGAIDPVIMSKISTLREYDTESANLVGHSDVQPEIVQLLPNQVDMLHWRDEYAGIEYDPKVRTVSDETLTIVPEESSITAAKAQLEKPIIIPGERIDTEREYDSVMVQAIPDYTPDMQETICGVYLSLLNSDTGGVARIGILTEDVAEKGIWRVALGDSSELEMWVEGNALQARTANHE